MRLGTETSSVNNWMLSGTKGQPKPEVGMGATILMWTDRKACTIVKVTRTQVHVQEDKAIRTDDYGMSDCQSYRYERDEAAPVMIFRLRKNGAYKGPGGQLRIGDRSAYHDYSF
jgi:hypothetical protein